MKGKCEIGERRIAEEDMVKCWVVANTSPYKQGMSCTAEQLSTFLIIQYNVTIVNESRKLIYQLQVILRLANAWRSESAVCINRKVLRLLRLPQMLQEGHWVTQIVARLQIRELDIHFQHNRSATVL